MSRATGEASTSSAGRVRLSGSRRGPIGQAIEAALEGIDLHGEQLVFAALARQTARAVDAAFRVDDLGALLRSTRELRELVDLLPIRGSRPEPEGGEHDDGTPRARVLELLDSPPSVGDRT